MVQNKNGFMGWDWLDLVNALIKKAWLIILCVILFAVGGFCYALFFIAPSYQASVMFYVNGTSRAEIDLSKSSFSTSDMSAGKSLIGTYIVILNTRNTLNEVIKQSGEDLSYERLGEMISASAVSDTAIFKVTVTSKDPLQAEHLANTVADVLPQKITSVVEGTSARIVEYAMIPTKRSGPDFSRYVIRGAIYGFIFAIALIILLMFLDYQIHDEDYLLNAYPDIPLLAVVPDFNVIRTYEKYSKRKKKKKHNNDNGSYYSTDGAGDRDTDAAIDVDAEHADTDNPDLTKHAEKQAAEAKESKKETEIRTVKRTLIIDNNK